MAFSKKVINFTQPTSTGLQTITVGFQTKVGQLFWSNRTSDGSGAKAFYGYGMFTGASNQCAGSSESEDNRSGALVGNTHNDAFAIRIIDVNGTVVARAVINSITSTEVVFDWQVVDSNARIISLEAWGGSDITDAWVGSITARTTNGTQDYTTHNFDADCYIFQIPLYTQSAGDSGNSHRRWMYGVAIGTAAGDQWYVGSLSRNGDNPTTCFRRQKSGKCIGLMASDGSILLEANMDTKLSNGIRLNWTASTTADRIFMLAVKGPKFKAGLLNQRTSDGSQNRSVGIKVEALVLASFNNTANTAAQNHARHSFGFVGASNERACYWSGERHAVATTIAKHNVDQAKALKFFTEESAGPTANGTIDVTALNDDGWTEDHAGTDGTAREYAYLAVGVDTPAASGKAHLMEGKLLAGSLVR